MSVFRGVGLCVLLVWPVLGASLMRLVHPELPFFQRMSRLNFDYYIRDDTQKHGGTAKSPLVVRLGNAHYWQYPISFTCALYRF